MKKLFKSHTFWSGVVSVLIIVLNLIGQDPKNTVIAFSNYPLYAIMTKMDFTLTAPFATDHALYFGQRFLWFGLHFATYVVYSVMVDLIISKKTCM